jgi:predicted nucleic acid-binding protein
MTPVFVDTSAFVALVDRRDRNHGAAKRILKALSRGRRPLVTSTYVLDETLTLVRLRIGHAVAVRFGEQLATTSWCRTLEVLEDTRAAAWQIFVRYEDQDFSFTDCTSFALMHAMGLTEACTFDRSDYRAAGFVPLV